jgi:deoxycytidylate deaminase
MVVVLLSGTPRSLGFGDALEYFCAKRFLPVELIDDESGDTLNGVSADWNVNSAALSTVQSRALQNAFSASFSIHQTKIRLHWKKFIEFCTQNFLQDIAVDCAQIDFATLASISHKRPFFCTVFLERPPLQDTAFSISDHLQRRLLNSSIHCFYDGTVQDLHAQLNLFDFAQVARPKWKSYFIQLATLYSKRSNCMKRSVGCIIEKSNRVIAAGYNGTPQGMLNCLEGGCPRCNSCEIRGGEKLEECFCIHAEENALLECGRNAAGATLYCTSCPCIGCVKKIVQCGIVKVVFSEAYHMDSLAYEFLTKAGISLEKY